MSYLEEIKALSPFAGQTEELKPLESEEIEALYAAAYGLYEGGNFPKAAGLFTHLILNDPFQSRFWKGLASSHQQERQFEAALHAWAILSLLENHQPDAHFHAAECLLSDGKEEDALKALQLAKTHCSESHHLASPISTLEQRIGSDGH